MDLKSNMVIASRKEGFTLVELLIGIAVMGLIVGALYQVIGVTLSSYHATDDRAVLVPEARYALERMVMFVQETDYIGAPDAIDPSKLVVSERVSNQYDNISHAYKAEGDDYLDADNDHDGLINGGGGVPAESITFRLDKADATNGCDETNGCLKEKMPDYGTPQTGDHKEERIICEHVTEFSWRRLQRPDETLSSIVEITLRLKQGNATVSLQTTAKAKWVD